MGERLHSSDGEAAWNGRQWRSADIDAAKHSRPLKDPMRR
jgi:hypothetical protein